MGRLVKLRPSRDFALVPGWMMAVATAMLGLQQYGSQPGLDATAPLAYPDHVSVARDVSVPNLIVFVHPHCPCSNATISELERLVARLNRRATAKVVFWHPSETAAEWHKTSLWSRALSIPDIEVIDDAGAVLAKGFGVSTSGQALLYDADGRLQFQGGITSARGHAGDSIGSETVLSLVSGFCQTSTQSCPVYGCSIRTAGIPLSAAEGKP